MKKKKLQEGYWATAQNFLIVTQGLTGIAWETGLGAQQARSKGAGAHRVGHDTGHDTASSARERPG